MIAARIARQDAEPAPRRDLIGTLLLTGIEWTDARPGLMLACVGALIVLAGVLEAYLP